VQGVGGKHWLFVQTVPPLHVLEVMHVAAAQIEGLSGAVLHTSPGFVHSAFPVQTSAVVSTMSEHDAVAAAIAADAIRERTSRARSPLVSPNPTECIVRIARSLGVAGRQTSTA
jgi:hypothetical protein